MIAFLRRLFVHDLGRKLLALCFAVVLFDLLDAKVQGRDRLTLDVVYVDASELPQLAEAPARTSKLLVVERADAQQPLVVADRPRPNSVTLQIDAPKDAIERLKARRLTFLLPLQKEGDLVPTAADLGGIDVLRDMLGAGAQVEIDPPLRLAIEAEERRALLLVPEDIVLRGTPAPGFDRGSRTTVTRPNEVTLVGPRRFVAQALERRAELFEAVLLDGTSRQVNQGVGLALQWRDRIRLVDATGAPLDSVRVTLEFKRRMVPVPEPDGLFELPVQVVCNDELLRRDDPQRSWRDGWRLAFPQSPDDAPRLRLQFSATESAVAGALDRVKLELARDEVELVVRAHELANVERGTLRVAIVKFADFPDDLELALAPGEPNVVEVEWVAPAPASDAGSGEKGGEDDRE